MVGAHASVPGQATQDLGAHSRYDGPHTIPPPPELHIYFFSCSEIVILLSLT